MTKDHIPSNSSFISFNNYEGANYYGTEVVPIVPIRRVCSRWQLPICLAWAITVHKSQGLALPKAKIDLGTKEFAACPFFVAVSRVRALKDLFSPFSFERLERIKFCIGVECHYQKLLCQNRIEKSQPLTISKAWNNVSKNTIIHSWQKTGSEINDGAFEKLEQLIRQIPRNNDGEILNASEFIQCDELGS
ncbi:ATP-dependent DNA helicase PIF1-like [Rhizophagus irregularis DAOM 181602=DAOM 197198]|uniref:Pif1p n=1 Tax=Rhizophagus irregularis (strain DAOM 197198w) TaxID=1432141 RepID=A0A015L445_RHIIW|nr:Pif1p [Rhizophagus irregularis DAOM 197198w]GBC16319.1 ATP-dependent DNA helicase PIF1-like [Rhizophagus irregularis DAOM 181602=DAOM 197198]